MTEPKVVVAHREHLWWLLAEAAQLEHMIMCQYLYAEFSLKDGSGDGLAAGQAEAVGRWRKTLREIATSPQFGAPNTTVPLPERSTNGSVGLSSAVGAVTDGSEGRMVGLFVALLAVTAVSLGFAASRRRNV